MSLEDLDSDFLSDESDYEAEKNLSGGENDGDDESNYLELVHLHNNLMCFEHIYNNNAIVDMQYIESELGPSYGFDSVNSELALFQEYIESAFEDVFSTHSSTSSSVTSHGDGLSSDTDDSALSFIQDFVQLYEEVISASSSSPSDASDGAYGQMANVDDVNNSQDGVAEGQL